jgi:hypothetical protein
VQEFLDHLADDGTRIGQDQREHPHRFGGIAAGHGMPGPRDQIDRLLVERYSNHRPGMSRAAGPADCCSSALEARQGLDGMTPEGIAIWLCFSHHFAVSQAQLP